MRSVLGSATVARLACLSVCLSGRRGYGAVVKRGGGPAGRPAGLGTGRRRAVSGAAAEC